MKLSNGWNDNTKWPEKPGDYHIITILRVKDPMENLDLVVRDGDCVVETDYFDGTDWESNPQLNIETEGGWEIVAWKELTLSLLPTEYSNAVLFNDLPDRPSYREELRLKEEK